MENSLFRVCASVCTSLGLVISSVESLSAADTVSSQTQILELKEGVNAMGLYVAPNDLNLDSILSEISEYVVYVKDEKGRTWRNVNGEPVNTIGDVIPNRGYLIKVSKDINLTVTGTPLDSTKSIKLTEGYNLFTFLSETPLDPLVVFPSLSPDFTFLEDINRELLIFKDGMWDSKIDTLEKGNIYLAKMSNDREVVFSYKVSTEATGNGLITKTETVNIGSTYTVHITPDYRYEVSDLFIDGANVTPQTTYTFNNLDSAHSVKVIFAPDPDLYIPDTDNDGLNDKLEDMLGLDKDDDSDVTDPRKLAFSFDKDGDGAIDLYERIKGAADDDKDNSPVTDFTVDPNLEENTELKIYNTLAAAIAVADDYDIITVAPGRYDESIELSGKSLLIRAQSKINRSTFRSLNLNNTAYGSIVDGFVFSDSNDLSETTLTNDHSLIINCVWEKNEGYIELTNSSNEFRNCIFRENMFENTLNNSDPLYVNCTFVNNAFADTLFEYNWDATTSASKLFTIKDSIVYGNIMNGVSSDCTISYSYVQGGATGDGNIDINTEPNVPVNRLGFLLPDSPCINAGSPDSKVLYGHYDTPAQERRDIGAVEFLDSDDDGVCDAQELSEGTNPNDTLAFRDFNFDYIPDALQLLPGNTATTVDSDLDGLTDSEEIAMRSNPNSKDSDDDGLSDSWEAFCNLNYLDPTNANEDSDDDNLTDLQEFALGTNPHTADTDRDTMPDGWEVKGTLNPTQNDASGDKDTDTYKNLIEFIIDSKPQESAAETPINITIN